MKILIHFSLKVTIPNKNSWVLKNSPFLKISHKSFVHNPITRLTLIFFSNENLSTPTTIATNLGSKENKNVLVSSQTTIMHVFSIHKQRLIKKSIRTFKSPFFFCLDRCHRDLLRVIR